jgi:hypothetical protein
LRIALNRIHAYLLAGLDTEGRRALDEALTAPAGGWEAAEERLLTAIDRAAQEG